MRQHKKQLEQLNLSAIEYFKASTDRQRFFIIGMCAGLMPYVIHQAPYIIKWVYA